MDIKHRNKMKHILFCLLAFTFFTACDSDKDDVIKPNEEQNINPEEENSKLVLSLKADVTERHLLEITKMALHSEKAVTVADIREAYDKLEWVVKNKSGETYSYSLLREHGMTFGWGHCFYAPGTYTTAVIGSKDGKEIFRSNEVIFNIAGNKDFLEWNWDKLPNSSSSGQSHVNVLDSEFELTSRIIDEQGKRGIYVYCFNDKNEDMEVFNKKSADKLYCYITKLYGEPALDKDDSQLDETYCKEFSCQFKDNKPLAIWNNKSTRIVLLHDKSHELEKVVVFAEPFKQLK